MNFYKKRCDEGYTLVEAAIAIAVSSIIMISLYQMFYSQQNNFMVHNEAYNMNQNLRSAIYLISKEIRSAGYNPTKSTKQTIGFVKNFSTNIFQDIGGSDISYTTDKDRIAFSLDKNSDKCIDADNAKASAVICDMTTKDLNAPVADGERGEQIAYRLYKNNLQRFNSEVYSATNSLEDAWQIIATNVDALNFVFLNQNGSPVNDPIGKMDDVKSIEVSILVRTGVKDSKYTNETMYKNKQGDILCVSCINDHYHRQHISTTVQLRNL